MPTLLDRIKPLGWLILLSGMFGIVGATSPAPARIIPLQGFITTVTVKWNPELTPPENIDAAGFCRMLQYDTELYLKAHGLIATKEVAPAEAVGLQIVLNDPARKPGKGPSLNRLLGIPKLSGRVSLTGVDGKIIQSFDVSFSKTDSLQTSHDGSAWSWLSLRLGRHIAESLHPLPENPQKDATKALMATPVPAGSARILLFRRGDFAGLIVRPMILVDGVALGTLRGNRVIGLDLAPGKHRISAFWNGMISESIALPPIVTEFEASAGSTTYFQYTYEELADKYDPVRNTQMREIKQTLDPVEASKALTALEKISKK